MCKDPCDEAMEHFKIMIEKFVPDHPANISSGFLYNMLVNIKEKYRKGTEICINYSDGHKNVPCWVIVDNGIILGLQDG
jgi:hypothetical protein